MLTADEQPTNNERTAKVRYKYMTLKDLQNLEPFQTQLITNDLKDNRETIDYVGGCLMDFLSGNYGVVPEKFKQLNKKQFSKDKGLIVGQYKKDYNLTSDIYIVAFFSKTSNAVQDNHIMILYVNELIKYRKGR